MRPSKRSRRLQRLASHLAVISETLGEIRSSVEAITVQLILLGTFLLGVCHPQDQPVRIACALACRHPACVMSPTE
jgi:hypothetical protein